MPATRQLKRTTNLTEHRLVFATSAVVTREALADTSAVVTETTAGAVTARLVTKSLHHISTRGTLDERAIGTTATQIAHTSYVLLSVPGAGVGTGSLSGELALSEAHARVGAFIGAHSALTCDTLVVVVALACAVRAVTVALVGAFHDGVCVVGVDNGTDPSLGLGASATGAIGTSPCWLTVDTVVAGTLIVVTARSVTVATIGAVSPSVLFLDPMFRPKNSLHDHHE